MNLTILKIGEGFKERPRIDNVSKHHDTNKVNQYNNESNDTEYAKFQIYRESNDIDILRNDHEPTLVNRLGFKTSQYLQA